MLLQNVIEILFYIDVQNVHATTNSLDSKTESHITSIQTLIWRRFQGGDRSALDEIFRAHYSALYHYGMKVIGNDDWVRDGIQDVFLHLWNRRETISLPKSQRAYLIVSLRHSLLETKKRLKARNERNQLYNQELFVNEFTIEEFLIQEETEQERVTELVRALNQLSAKQKEIIYLRYYHGLTNEEIAEIMEINLQSVKNSVYRTLQVLKAQLSASTLALLLTLPHLLLK